jgi:drug/metabolite transporter (DMT)-like permease
MWVWLTLSAGILQSTRNALAHSLAGAVPPALNSWARFAFNLPFSLVLFAVMISWKGVPISSNRYFLRCLATGVAQILGSVALVAAFRYGSFARTIVLHKLEILFTAIIGTLIFAEVPTTLGWIGIVVSAMGVALLHARRTSDRSVFARFDRGSALAVLAGLFLVFASFWLKEANAELAHLNPRVGEGRFEVSVHTLFHVTWMEVVLLTLWLVLREPRRLPLVGRHWRRMGLIGAAGFAGSLCWFWAYSLTLVAYVKAVGQIESIAAVVYSIMIFGERDVLREIPGMAVISAGILLILFGGAPR